MSDADAREDREPPEPEGRVDAGQLGTNLLRVNDPAHLPMLCGDSGIEAGTIELSTAEGWARITAEGSRVVVDEIDAPAGHGDTDA